MARGYGGTKATLERLGGLAGAVLFVLIAGYVLAGTPTAGIGAIVAVTVFFVVGTLIYVLVRKLTGLGRRLRTH